MTEENLTVTMEELRTFTNMILGHLESVGQQDLELRHDYFWSIGPDELYDVYESPGELTIGQISESLATLRRISSGKSPPIGYALVWLADILRAIGHQSIG
jgi:hypothetical protein